MRITTSSVGAHGAHTLLDGAHLIDTALHAATAGDVLFTNAVPLHTGLGIGAAGNVLTVVAGLPAWAAPAAGGNFVKLGSVDLVAPAANMSVAWVGTYNRILAWYHVSGKSINGTTVMRFNNDAGANYCHSYDDGPGGTGSAVNQTAFVIDGGANLNDHSGAVTIHNQVAQNKTFYDFGIRASANAGIAPGMHETGGMYVSGAVAITRIDVLSTTALSLLNAGSWLYVYGLT